MSHDLVDLIRQLVAIPSVNPMGRDVVGEMYYESRLTDYLERFLRRLGLTVFRQPVEPDRDNLYARLDGEQAGGEAILLEAHQDTVPVDGMTIDPFGAELRAGRIYGRGACDVKGGMAAILAALGRLAAEPPSRRRTIVAAFTVNEENGFTGAEALVRGLAGELAPVLAARPAACIVTEPTSLRVVTAHRGVVRWKCHTSGRAAHSSEPERGENAIYRMARVVVALEHYAACVLPTIASHPLCGRPTLSVGTIDGGSSVNTVPDRATIEIDRRLVPGEELGAAVSQVRRFLESRPEIDFAIQYDEPYLAAGTLSDHANAGIARQLAAAGAIGEPIGVAYSTNANTYAAAGLPSVVFGPGSIDQAHTADEWIAVDEVRAAAEVLYQLGRSAG